MNAQNENFAEKNMKILLRIGGAAAILLIAYTLAVMAAAFGLGVAPETAAETFALLQSNRIVGLLRLDALTVAGMPLYYLFFAGICAALWKTRGAQAGLATALVFVGVTLFISTPSVTALVTLSDKFAAAATEAQKAQFLAAGEAVIASNMWNSFGSAMGGILMQAAGVWLAALMLRGGVFGKAAAVAGILTYGLDLLHILFGFFSPELGLVFMMIASPFYLIWFPLVARTLLRLGRETAGGA